LALKTVINLGFFRRIVQYSRFRWNYAKPFNPNTSQVTILGVNDETLGVIGNPGYVFDILKIRYNYNKSKVLYQNIPSKQV
jgi:hypothetical protein